MEKNKILEAWDLLKYNPKIEEKDIPLILRIAENFQFNEDSSNEIDVLKLVVKIQKDHSLAWFLLWNKSFVHAYKDILQAKLLNGDLIFINFSKLCLFFL